LRFERYLPADRRERILRSIYYKVRPALAFPIRKLIQRSIFLNRCSTFPTWPVDGSVEEIFRALMKRIMGMLGVEEIPFIWFWPEGYNSALMMTHDVEEAQGAANSGMLMDLDMSFGIPAAFQVVPEGRYRGVAGLIDEIRGRGFEVNLHDLDHDGTLFEDARRFRERATRINRYTRQYRTKGFRAGSMNRNQSWLHFLEIEYDMSVPNVAHFEPQAGGCCTVMPYMVDDIVELPLTTVQDYALFYILREHSVDLWKRQIQIISRKHGLISFIIHPDYVVRKKERRVYCKLLDYIAKLQNEGQTWISLPNEINTWCRQRSRMRMVHTQAGWEIQGEGSERARVASAQLVDGELIFRVDRERPSPDSIGQTAVSATSVSPDVICEEWVKPR